MQEIEFEIDRDAVKQYFLSSSLLGCFGILSLCCSPFILPVILHPLLRGHLHSHTIILFFMVFMIFSVFLGGCFVFLQWLCPQQANNLRYRLEGDTLRVDGGVFFLFRKSIPLERITDVALVQGPILRFFNIWALSIQTAGSPHPEAALYGVREPEKVRELILARRKGIDGEKTEDA